jgi:hypothetical protein
MHDPESEDLPDDLHELGERLRDLRPRPDQDALDRALTRAQRTPSRRRAPWARWPRRREVRRPALAAFAAIGATLCVVGTASALTVSLAGLGPTVAADIKAKLHITAPGTTVDVNLSDPAQAQYLGAPCLTALVTLGQLQAGAVIHSLTVTLQQGVVEVVCGGAAPHRILAASTNPLVFANTARGSHSATKVETYTNVGNAPLSIGLTTLSLLARFDITASTCTLGTVLQVGDTCAVTLRFSPLSLNSTGLKTATLTVTSTAPTVNVTLQGTAT